MSATFTGQRLDWLTSIRFDRRVTDYAYRVASVIGAHLNEKSGRAFLSYDTIAFETGSKWPRKVGRAIKVLEAAGWLIREHTKTANVYKPDFRNVRSTLAIIGRARYEKRERFLNNQARLGLLRPTAPQMPHRDEKRQPDSDANVR